jgi:hypothetical protein
MNGCSYLCTPAQRAGLLIFSRRWHCLPHFCFSSPKVFFRPVIRRDHIISTQLHAQLPPIRSRTLLSASLAFTGRAPAVLLLLNVLPVSTDSLT